MSLCPVLARLCLVGLLAPTLAFALPPADPEMVAQAEAIAERMRENRDSGLAAFVQQDGMALLVIPTLNLDAGPKRDFDDPATRENFLRQQSMLTRWNHKTDGGLAITVGHGEHKLDILDPGPLFQTAQGKVTYQVIPVWPGEYQLDRIKYHVPNMTIPRMTWLPDTTAELETIGVSTMRYRDDDVYKKTGPWPQHKIETDDGLGVGCQVVLRLGGGCDEAARELRWQLSAERGVVAGTAEQDTAAGLDVDLTFDPIATIKLEKGEVVLTDGFVLMDGQPVMVEDMCAPGRDQMKCPMQSLTVERLRTSVEEFRQAPSAASLKMPKLDAVLQNLVYRAPKLHIKPVDKASPNVMRAEAD